MVDEESVVAAVQRDLEAIGERDPGLARSGYAMAALVLARELDGKSSATSKSMCARALSEALDRLRELAPEPQREMSKVDELRSRRAARHGRAAAADSDVSEGS